MTYKFDEGKYVAEVLKYIDATYDQHYSGKYQATDMIIDAGHGTGFNIGNIMKYAKRYGKKGGYNKKDLLKIIHYAIIQLYVHDTEIEAESSDNEHQRTDKEITKDLILLCEEQTELVGKVLSLND